MEDMEYLKSLYPGVIKQVQSYVSDACDRLEYNNSPMYDEYPDQEMVHQVSDYILNNLFSTMELKEEGNTWQLVKKEEDIAVMDENPSKETELVETQNIRRPWGPPLGGPGPVRPPQGPPPWDMPPGGPGPVRPPQGPPPWGMPPGGPGPVRPPQGPPPWGMPPGGPGPVRPPRPPYRPPVKPYSGPSWFRDLIKVLLLNEIHQRRCRVGICR